ncbi:hypothetical protein [Microlunatus flavus]|uniref:DUF4352 domain-containing protein n=1 Tax=Microlunatus flavus TaxID=1036181 RepID=A0A1H9AWH2_9ACTN|nr:hypothetical protein [Microlunatus flavus]SEP80753.1 hypothetical protein SAMN05421756_101747 [Microlunatus flavus]
MTTPADAGPRERTGDEEQAEAELLRRGRLLTAVVALVVVALVAAVALLGGFERRQDAITPVPVGSAIETGPYVVTVERATARRSSFDDGWRVEVTGTARTTGTESIRPGSGGSAFVYARSVATREVQEYQSATVGAGGALSDVSVLTPGLPPVPWTMSFTFAQPPGDALLVVVFEQEYTTPYIFGDEKAWRPGRDASTMTLPVEQLKD